MSADFKMLLKDINLRGLEMQESHYNDKDRASMLDGLHHNRNYYEKMPDQFSKFSYNVSHALSLAPVLSSDDFAIPSPASSNMPPSGGGGR